MGSPPRRPLRTIDTPAGSFELLEDGVIWFTAVPGAVFDVEVAQQAHSAAEELAAGLLVAIVADARELSYADRAARNLLTDAEMEGRVATAAIVSGRVLRWLADQYGRSIGSRRLFRVFDSEDAAHAWAIEQVRRARDG